MPLRRINADLLRLAALRYDVERLGWVWAVAKEKLAAIYGENLAKYGPTFKPFTPLRGDPSEFNFNAGGYVEWIESIDWVAEWSDGTTEFVDAENVTRTVAIKVPSTPHNAKLAASVDLLGRLVATLNARFQT